MPKANLNLKAYPVTSTEFFEIEALENYYKNLNKDLLDLLKVFIQVQVKNDTEALNNVKQKIISRPDITHYFVEKKPKLLHYLVKLNIEDSIKQELRNKGNVR